MSLNRHILPAGRRVSPPGPTGRPSPDPPRGVWGVRPRSVGTRCAQGPAESVGGHVTTENTIIPTRAIQLMERALAEIRRIDGPIHGHG